MNKTKTTNCKGERNYLVYAYGLGFLMKTATGDVFFTLAADVAESFTKKNATLTCEKLAPTYGYMLVMKRISVTNSVRAKTKESR